MYLFFKEYLVILYKGKVLRGSTKPELEPSLILSFVFEQSVL